jgi:cysteinyl-tRNA synthetase
VLGLFQVQVKDWQFIPNAINLMLGVPWPIEMRVAGPTYVIVHDTEIERQIAERNEARRRKDFTRADEIRKALAENGIILEDRPDGTTRWKR